MNLKTVKKPTENAIHALVIIIQEKTKNVQQVEIVKNQMMNYVQNVQKIIIQVQIINVQMLNIVYILLFMNVSNVKKITIIIKQMVLVSYGIIILHIVNMVMKANFVQNVRKVIILIRQINYVIIIAKKIIFINVLLLTKIYVSDVPTIIFWVKKTINAVILKDAQFP